MKSTFKSYLELIKFRLTSTVVATSSFGYLIALKSIGGEDWLSLFNWWLFAGVLIGGMFIVFAANGMNQIIEKENDAKMSRTSNRPIVEDRIDVKSARIFCWITGILGLFVLMASGASFLAVLLGGLSLVVYVFVYTPMKQVSPMAVLVGAIPGALPPWIGYAAVVPRVDELGFILFLVQFFWQFPHFWAIAWILHEDYQKAGYWLLPTKGGRDKRSAYQVLIYTVILNLVSMMPLMYGIADIKAISVIIPVGVFFLFKAYRLFQTLEVSEARKLLYASFLYTPVVFLCYILF
ncbi:MAG: heme o synthase [Bacteroidia bacterium]|jgi:protoheme IX farnesyltransferase|nr:heme o synthase [Bacteroidia bacterium]MDB2588552.1 heme o synthase [Bacteroidia bacterium]MDG1747229.1 heme o synthase [Bacteroidia bacterium]